MKLEDLELKSNEPYPEIKNVSKDMLTVGLIKNIVSSRVGELKSILQYTYQSVISEKINDEISRIFQEIAIVEMIHLDLLLRAEIAFGGDGKFEDAQGNMFNTSLINYSGKLKDILDYDIASEYKAIETYQNTINRIKNESLRNLFARIIVDEKKHIFALEQIKNNVEFLSI